MKKHLSVKPDNLAPIKGFKEQVSQQIKCCFIPDSLEIVEKPPLLAAAVDPHYHQLKFVNERQGPLVHAALKEKVDEVSTDQDVIECESPSASETILKKSQKTKDTALSFLLENDARESIEGQKETEDFLRIQSLSSAGKMLNAFQSCKTFPLHSCNFSPCREGIFYSWANYQ